MAKLTLKNSKEDIYKAYTDALKETARLEKELAAAQEELADSEDYDDEDGDSNSSYSGDIQDAQDIIGSLTAVQQGIAQALSSLSAEQVIEAEQIQKIAGQISAEKAEVKSLYNIDLSGSTFEGLVSDYEKEKATFEEAFANKKKSYSDDLNGKNQAWAKEVEEYNRQLNDRNKEAQVSRKREQDEYDYAAKQARALEDDVYAQKRKKLTDELIDTRATKDKEWAAKEKAIADAEAQLADYKRKFEAAEGEIQKEVKKAEAEGKSIIERDHKVKLALYNADVDANQKAADLKIKSLDQTIKSQDEQLKKVSAQLENVIKQAQSLALKALEGSTNAESFAAIREIAIEQAKNSNKSK